MAALASLTSFIARQTRISADWLNAVDRSLVGPVQYSAAAYSTLQAALTAAAGSTVIIPRGTYSISTALTVASNTEVVIQPGTTITQTTKYQPVFDLNQVDDVVIRGNGALLQWTGSRAYTGGGSSFRGGDPYIYGAGVWAAGNRNRVHDLRVAGFTCGVLFSSWNGTDAETDYQWSGNEAHNIEIDDVDFGVLFAGQSDLTLRRIWGVYALQTNSPNPAHLVYASGINGRIRRLDIDGCSASDSTDTTGGRPYTFKGVDGGRAVNLDADGCSGWASIEDCHHLTLSGKSINDSGQGENGSLFFVGADQTHCTITAGIYAADDATGFRLARLNGTDNVLILKGRQRQTTDVAVHDVYVEGSRNTIDYDVVNIANDGTDLTKGRRGVLLNAGSGHQVILRQARNVKWAAEVLTGVTGCKVTIPHAASIVTASDTARTNTLLLTETTTALERHGVDSWSITTSAQTVRSDRTLYSTVYINVTTADDFTITNPYGNSPRGTMQTYIISNTSGGSMGTITWTGFTLATAWSNPASAAEKSIRFVWDGVRWKEIGRTA